MYVRAPQGPVGCAPRKRLFHTGNIVEVVFPTKPSLWGLPWPLLISDIAAPWAHEAANLMGSSTARLVAGVEKEWVGEPPCEKGPTSGGCSMSHASRKLDGSLGQCVWREALWSLEIWIASSKSQQFQLDVSFCKLSPVFAEAGALWRAESGHDLNLDYIILSCVLSRCRRLSWSHPRLCGCFHLGFLKSIPWALLHRIVVHSPPNPTPH